LDLFPNLKSLIISSSLPIYYDQLNIILKSKQFKKLNTFQVKSKIVDKNNRYNAPVFRKVFSNDNSLHIFESLPEQYISFKSVNSLKMSVNIQSLSLTVSNFKCLVSLLSYTPNLKYFNIRLLSFLDSNDQSNIDRDLSEVKLKKISFVLQNGPINQTVFLLLTSFIKQFSSSLIYLSLDFNQIKSYEFQFNGFILQQQLLESMIELKSFHLYMQLWKEPIDIESFLSTFQTQFWFDHHWIFGMHGKYFYTLPFHFDQLKDFIDFDQIKSSNSKMFNSLQTWSRVKSIDFSESFKFKSNVIKQFKFKMPNLQSTTLTFQLMRNLYENIDEINQTDISLDGITTVHCPRGYIQTVQHWLIHIFPNTRHLMLSYFWELAELSSNTMEFLQKFEEYFRDKTMTTGYICSSKIQYVEIKLTLKDIDSIDQLVIRLAKELSEIFQNLQSLIFHFYHNRHLLSIVPFIDLNEMILLLNMDKISEKYQIKHIHNYLQLVKKNNA
jgi:hypothetical protein